MTAFVMSSRQTEADAALVAGFNEAVLWAGVERILAVDEFRVQHAVALLGRFRLEVRQAFPVDEILCADNAGSGECGGEVVHGLILAFAAEHAVDIAVFVLRQTHIVDVRFLGGGVWQDDRVIIKAEALHRVIAARDGEEGLSVIAFYAGDEAVLTVQLDGAGVHDGVHAETLKAQRICLLVQVKFPERRNVVAGEDRILVTRVNAVVKSGRLVLFCDERFVIVKRLFNVRVHVWYLHTEYYKHTIPRDVHSVKRYVLPVIAKRLFSGYPCTRIFLRGAAGCR